MTIRQATDADLPQLLAMGERFIASTSYSGVLASNPDQMAQTARGLIGMDTGCVLVGDDGGSLIGMIGMIVFTHHISGQRVAGEVFWWVEPEKRGVSGIRLLKAAEAWAKAHGAATVQMTAPTLAVGDMYARLGYAPVETLYQRPVA